MLLIVFVDSIRLLEPEGRLWRGRWLLLVRFVLQRQDALPRDELDPLLLAASQVRGGQERSRHLVGDAVDLLPLLLLRGVLLLQEGDRPAAQVEEA